MAEDDDNIWVFGYGSLMWRPGFVYRDRLPAILYGYHRALCIEARHHRGTPDNPGLVLGLDRGGSCRGLAFRVDRDAWPATKAYLDAREMPDLSHPAGPVYRPGWHPLRIGGRRIRAYTYVARRDHPQYLGRLPTERALALIRSGHGVSGSALDYLRNTVEHLDALEIPDGPLHRLLRQV